MRLQFQAIPLLYSTLTDKEKQVLAQIYRGRRTEYVAREHHVAVATIATQRSMILRKMAVDNTVELVFLIKTAKLYGLHRIIQELRSRSKEPLAEISEEFFSARPGSGVF